MKENNEKIDLAIGESTLINGNIESKGSIRIDGKIKGDINCGFMLIIGEKGEIEGNIQSITGIIGGKVKGNISIKDFLELNQGANIHGDISTNLLKIDRGAIFNGNCVMNKSKKGEN